MDLLSSQVGNYFFNDGSNSSISGLAALSQDPIELTHQVSPLIQASSIFEPIFSTEYLGENSPISINLTHSSENCSFATIDRALGVENGTVDLKIAALLKQFFSKDDYLSDLNTAFGSDLNSQVAANIAKQVTEGSQLLLPVVQILGMEQIDGAEGGFDLANNKIYIAQEIVNTKNFDTIISVAIEEIGHYLDTKLNTQDAVGDEGQIFENLVNGKAFTVSQLAEMKAEDDRTTIQINGQTTTVEKAEGDNGVYTVDRNGKISVDFLTDAGVYKNQLAIFSLTGMETLTPGSVEYIQEAARRALTNTREGYVVVNDATDAGKFNLEAGTNAGEYQGRKDFTFTAGDKIALMLVPNGTIQEIFNNPNLAADKRPLFSIDGANPGSFKQVAKVANSVIAWEDIRRDGQSDADFNDLVFQIKGTLGTGANDLKTTAAPNITWQDSQVCKDMENYAAQELGKPNPKPPVLTLSLVNDTGSSSTDGITKDPTIAFAIKEGSTLLDVTAKFAGSDKSLNILDSIAPNGTLRLNRELLERIYGASLTDNTYHLALSATDDSGKQGTANLNFTLDTTAPTKPTIVLDAASDSGIVGDNRTNFAAIAFSGTADPHTQVKICQTPTTGALTPIFKTITTDAAGNYQLTGVGLNFGINRFDVETTDLAGNTATTTREIRQIAKDDQVITWNQILLDAIAVARTAPPVASRAMAIMQTAVFDAVNNIAKKYKNYAITAAAPLAQDAAAAAVQSEAAAVEAAYTVLISLFASQKATFDAQRTISLAAIQDGQAKTDGIAFGEQIGTKALAARIDDGSRTVVTPPASNNPGDWVATAVVTNPDGTTSPAPAVLPQWGNVKTFGILQADVMTNLPASPPALTSQQYAIELNQVQSLGAANSTTRTAEQTEIAKFWADGGGTFTPPGHWNQIAQDAARDRGNSLVDNARIFAALDVAQADAAISCWAAKYTYNRWRPITAIRNADRDGNDQTTADVTWTPLLTTPNFPAYTSGHSTFSGAAAAVLTSFYGDGYNFSSTGPSLPGVTRNFTSFNQAADEAGISRIYGGIHFMSDNLPGLASGKIIGTYVASNLFGLA